MHTRVFRNDVSFHFNSDFSGQVRLEVPKGMAEVVHWHEGFVEIRLPGEVLLDLAEVAIEYRLMGIEDDLGKLIAQRLRGLVEEEEDLLPQVDSVGLRGLRLGHRYKSNGASRDPCCSICGQEDHEH